MYSPTPSAIYYGATVRGYGFARRRTSAHAVRSWRHVVGTPVVMEHEVEFRASRWRALWLGLGSVGLAATGIWIGRSGSWIGWAAAAFFGLAGVVAAIQLIGSGRTVLRLDPAGFAMIQWGLGRSRSKDVLSWTDVESFWVTRFIWTKAIAMRYSPSFRKYRQARSAMRKFTGLVGSDSFDGIIPNQYTESLKTICATLNEWKRRYG
jgi:hypothetical protein